MAHIPDGVLSAPVLITGGAVTLGLLAASLRRIDYERLPEAAVLSAAFFVSSLISLPIGPSSAHLLLNGLMGLLLGWAALPALFVALVLQAVFFGHGGVLVLGVNAMNLGVPALLCAFALRPMLTRMAPRRLFGVGVAAGLLGVSGSALMLSLSLVFSGEAFMPAARVIVLIYVPLALIEGIVSGTVVAFLQRVDPELLLNKGTSDA